MNRALLIVPLVLGCSFLTAPDAAAEGGLASRILAMTGQRTKIVWARATKGKEGKNWEVLKEEYELMIFDTAEGKARRVLPGPAMYACPWITPDGNSIIFTTRAGKNDEVQVVGVDGKNRRRIAKGFGHCVWADPKTGTQWVYISVERLMRILPNNTTDWVNNDKNEMYRYRIDKPSVRQLVWKGPSSIRFRVSADGTRAGSEFGWPNAGVADLTNGTWKRYGTGCNSMIAPDNSYRFFHMGAPLGHNGVLMYDAGGTNKRSIWFKDMPGSKPGADSWIPKWSSDVRFLTITSPSAGNLAEVFLGQFDDRFTRIVKWVRITNRPGQDAYAYAWIQAGLRFWAGEVPYRVSIPAPGKGTWQWDFGDGRKARGRTGRHTYRKVGNYVVTASQGEIVLKGSVNVMSNLPLRAVSTTFLDEATLQVRFNQKVKLEDAEAKLKSRIRIDKLEPGHLETDIILYLEGKLPRSDTLRLKGVYTQTPRRKTIQKIIRIRRPTWPSNRKDLVMLLGVGEKERFHYDAKAEKVLPTTFVPWRLARMDRKGRSVFRGGVFSAQGAGNGISVKCGRANAFSIEVMIMPGSLLQGDGNSPRHIISCRYGEGDEDLNFRLSQAKSKLCLFLSTGTRGREAIVARVDLLTLGTTTPNHIVISYKPGELLCYLNGEEVKRIDALTGELEWLEGADDNGLTLGGEEVKRIDGPTGELEWLEGADDDGLASGDEEVKRIDGLTGELEWLEGADDNGLTLGGEPKTNLLWWGKLERMAVFARTLDPEEVTANYGASKKLFDSRPRIPHIVVKAKLTAKSIVPALNDIAPYTDALILNEYEVVEVLDDTLEAKKIQVLQWGVIDKTPTPITKVPVGSLINLELERKIHHPEIGSEVVRSSIEEDLDSDLYLDVTFRVDGIVKIEE